MTTAERADRMDKRLGDVMTIMAEESAQAAAAKMDRHKVGCLLVVGGGGKLIGVVTERDIMSRLVARSADPAGTPVSDIMTTDVMSCGPDTPLPDAQELLVRHRIRHLPIVNDGMPIGMVSSRDVMAYNLSLANAKKAEAERVAMLSSNLNDLSVDRLVHLMIWRVPGFFEAEWGALCFPEHPWRNDGSALVLRRGCPCLDADLCAREAPMEVLTDPQAVACPCPESCEHLGAESPSVVIPLAIDSVSGQDQAKRGYLCLCRMRTTSVENAEMASYRTNLLSNILSANLSRAILYRVARESETDPVTGLKGRWVLDRELKREHERAGRHERPFCTAIMDVDRFKEINDTWGHPEGDRILRELADGMGREVRSIDVLGRYGGDEFVLLMPETQLDDAEAVLKRIRGRAETTLRPDGEPVTVSCGVAQWSGRADETDADVLRRADAGLYEAKRAGRNCCMAGPAADTPACPTPAAAGR